MVMVVIERGRVTNTLQMILLMVLVVMKVNEPAPTVEWENVKKFVLV